ncbi:MAG: hypothetical protein P8182_09390 [Deltaproteobacteria bacterium]
MQSRILAGVVIVAASLICAGCPIKANKSLEYSEREHKQVAEKPSSEAKTDRGLIKPSIPSKAPEKSKETSGSVEKGGSSGLVVSRKFIGQKPRKPPPKEQGLLDAAIAEAKRLSAVEKMKLCYKHKEDEWWVSIYVDIGGRIDVKQFIWNRELEKLEPFLVIKRLPKTKLASELNAAEPGSVCEVVTLRLPARQ